MPYPEHEKLSAISDKSQACGEFLAWLSSQGIMLAAYHQHSDACWALHTHNDECSGRTCLKRKDLVCGGEEGALYPIDKNTETLLAEFFGIDRNLIEKEKRAMLSELRARQTPK